MTTLAEIDAAAAIRDPLERARALLRLLEAHQVLGAQLGAMRRDAIEAAAAGGMTHTQVAAALGVTQSRISAMLRRGEPERLPSVTTGWRSDQTEPAGALAITGSRTAATDNDAIDQAEEALVQLLLRRKYVVRHGPVGVGAEVITAIADNYSPEGLEQVQGILGHAKVVRDADYVLIVGGGKGTLSEADTALQTGKRVLPMPASGGTAASIYMRQLGKPDLRAWLSDADFSALATASGQQFADIAERVTGGNSD